MLNNYSSLEPKFSLLTAYLHHTKTHRTARLLTQSLRIGDRWAAYRTQKNQSIVSIPFYPIAYFCKNEIGICGNTSFYYLQFLDLSLSTGYQSNIFQEF